MQICNTHTISDCGETQYGFGEQIAWTLRLFNQKVLFLWHTNKKASMMLSKFDAKVASMASKVTFELWVQTCWTWLQKSPMKRTCGPAIQWMKKPNGWAYCCDMYATEFVSWCLLLKVLLTDGWASGLWIVGMTGLFEAKTKSRSSRKLETTPWNLLLIMHQAKKTTLGTSFSFKQKNSKPKIQDWENVRQACPPISYFVEGHIAKSQKPPTQSQDLIPYIWSFITYSLRNRIIFIYLSFCLQNARLQIGGVVHHDETNEEEERNESYRKCLQGTGRRKF